MRDLLGRLFRIARASLPSVSRQPPLFRTGRKHESPDGGRNGTRHRAPGDGSGNQRTEHPAGDRGDGQEAGHHGLPAQVVADLAVFGLTPPVTFETVQKARNREIKRYHPDRFGQAPEKQDTAKEILQIYNAAYARLKAHYGKS